MKQLISNKCLKWFLLRSMVLSLIWLAAAQSAWCEDTKPLDEQIAKEAPPSDHAEAFKQAAVYSGYRFVTPVDNPASAAPYQRQKSSAAGGFSAGMFGADLKLSADAQFLHSDDYLAELLLDYSGLYHLKLDSTAIWHNLQRLPPASATSVASIERDGGSSLGTRTVISRASNRFKLGNNPIHLNLNYWQLTREGTEQLRFSDYGFDVNPDSIITRSVPIDSVTREGTFGLDTHAGPINASYSFMIRDFSNQAPDSRDFFVARATQSAGTQAHDTVNDSRVTAHTFKLYSDLSGGLTASGLYSLTQRETSTDRGDARPSNSPADTLHTAAGDISYTPFKEMTLALKYRRLQIDRESTATVYSPYYTATAGTILLRPSSSSVKDTLILSASYRPVPKAVYRFEYQAQLESRNNLPDLQAPTNPAALRSDSRQTHTGKASFIWKPVNAIKFNSSYSYAVSDNPAYPNSFSDRHDAKALLSYTAKGRWGLTASYLGKYETGESNSLQASLPRESLSNSVSSSVWFSPQERITVTASYSFMQAAINQTNLFSSFVATVPVQTAGDYRSTAHVYSIEAVLAMTRMVDLSLAFQQTLSDVRFSASDNSQNATLSSAGIGDASRLVATETGITSRADWHIAKNFGCSLGYSFRMYDSGQALYDGSVHETLLALTGRW